MKNFKAILLIAILALLVMPFITFAEGEEEAVDTQEETTETTTSESDDKRVRIYFFRGEGCPHCEEAEEWFKSIQDEYGDKFVIVDYEVWYDEDNADLMDRVAEARGEDVSGVPYIIIGDMTFNGFDESYEESIISKIEELYAQNVSERYDIMSLLGEDVEVAAAENTTTTKSNASDIIAVIIILIIVAAGAYGVVYARKNTK